MKSLIIGFLFLFSIYSLNNYRSLSDGVLQEWLLEQNIYTGANAEELCQYHAKNASIKLHDDRLDETFTIDSHQDRAPLCAYYKQTEHTLGKMQATGQAKLRRYIVSHKKFPWRSVQIDYETISEINTPNKLNLIISTQSSLKLNTRILGGYSITDVDITSETNYR